MKTAEQTRPEEARTQQVPWKKWGPYQDSTPTHSHMKYLYKYPQAAYP